MLKWKACPFRLKKWDLWPFSTWRKGPCLAKMRFIFAVCLTAQFGMIIFQIGQNTDYCQRSVFYGILSPSLRSSCFPSASLLCPLASPFVLNFHTKCASLFFLHIKSYSVFWDVWFCTNCRRNDSVIPFFVVLKSVPVSLKVRFAELWILCHQFLGIHSNCTCPCHPVQFMPIAFVWDFYSERVKSILVSVKHNYECKCETNRITKGSNTQKSKNLLEKTD